MGLVIGLLPSLGKKAGFGKVLSRGAVFGFIVSGAWFVDTGFYDLAGFAAGIVYGMIIEYVASKY